jgi:hypothetical protein
MPNPLAKVTVVTQRLRLAFLLPPLTAAACGYDDLPEFGALVYEGDDFEVWASEGLEACGGTHAYTEGWLAAFRRRVGEHGSPTHHRFNWLSPEDQEDTPCSDGAAACAFTSRPSKPIYTSNIPHEHEIVHVELAPQVGHPLLTEGAAELFGSIGGPSSTFIVPIRELVGGDVPGLGYPSAGRFSRYLLDTHGLDAYFDLLNAGADAGDASELDAAFRETLDVTLEEAITDYETFSPCAPPRWRLYDYECGDLPPTPWVSPDRWEQTIALDCGEADVIGPRGDEPQIWTLRALEVETDGTFEIMVASDAPATAHLEPCFRGCFDETGAIPPSPSATTERSSGPSVLPPGRYWMRVEHPAESAAAVTVSIERR